MVRMHACVRVSIWSMRREVRPEGYLIDNVFPLPSSSLLVENENDGACIEKKKKEEGEK